MTPKMNIKLSKKYVYCVLYSHYVHSVLYCFLYYNLSHLHSGTFLSARNSLSSYSLEWAAKNCLKSNLLCFILKYRMRKVITQRYTPTHTLNFIIIFWCYYNLHHTEFCNSSPSCLDGAFLAGNLKYILFPYQNCVHKFWLNLHGICLSNGWNKL